MSGGISHAASARQCASRGWKLFVDEPGQHFIAGLLFIFIVSTVPILLPGPLWVGLCAMALAAQRGETVTLEIFFAPFGDYRAKASWIYGLLLTAIMTTAQILGMFILAATWFTTFVGMQAGEVSLVSFVFGITAGFAVMLLPAVGVAYWLFPAGFYIADGETDCFAAVRRGMRVVASNRLFWARFWGAMTLGHLAGVCVCCIGLAVVMPWNCLAMGEGLLRLDPAFGRRATRSHTSVPNLPER